MTFIYYDSRDQQHDTYDATSNILTNFRKAAKCHRTVSESLKTIMRPGMKYTDICAHVEKSVYEYYGMNNINNGMGFPVGISVNNIYAHDTAYIGDNRIINQNDIIKIDWGSQSNGYIIDTAHTYTFDNADISDKQRQLIDATRDATNTAIKMAGIDVLINDISKEIQTVIKSYDIEPANGIGGHNIEQYKIHAGKLILCKPDMAPNYQTMRMKQNEIYAIETFASTGTGIVRQDANIPITHYMLNAKVNQVYNFKITKQVYDWIVKNRGTMPFTQRWIEKDIKGNVMMGINELMKRNIITGYPALVAEDDAYTSQHEHTLYIHDKGIEVFSQT